MPKTSALLTKCAKCGGDCSSFALYIGNVPYHRQCVPGFGSGYTLMTFQDKLDLLAKFEEDIAKLSSVLLAEFGMPPLGESACEMAARLLLEYKARSSDSS